MEHLIELIRGPWPWYVSGPLLGLMVPILLLAGNKPFGLSSSFKHICAIVLPHSKGSFFDYNWKDQIWNLLVVSGIVLGGVIGAWLTEAPPVISEVTKHDLYLAGLKDLDGWNPASIFSFEGLLTLRGFIFVVVGGFFVGFGTRYANGCTSGHAIFGLSTMNWYSMIALVGFFAGGLLTTHFILPYLFTL